MKFDKLILKEEQLWKQAHSIDESFNLDKWMGYWMDSVDPLGSYRLSIENSIIDAGGDY